MISATYYDPDLQEGLEVVVLVRAERSVTCSTLNTIEAE